MSDTVLMKMENGVLKPLNENEIAQIKIDAEKDKIEVEALKVKEKEKEDLEKLLAEQKKEARKSLLSKLSALGITEQEFNTLVK